MPNNSKLIGKIDSEKELSLEIGPEHFSNLGSLVDNYGLAGKGLMPIFGNRHVRKILESHDVGTIVIDREGVHGIEAVPEADRTVLESIITKQFRRSEYLVNAVKNGDFERYDAVNAGVLSGLLLGIGVAAVFDVAGVRNTATEMAARLGPGIFEASSVSHHVFQEEEKIDFKMPFMWKLYYQSLEFTLKASSTAKRVPAGIYGIINPFSLADKVRGRILPEKVNKTLDSYLKTKENGELPTNTHTWSDAQESAPYRGAVAAAASRHWGMEKVAYGAFDSLAVFWVNSGNNVQGFIAVYNRLYHKAGETTRSAPKRAAKAFRELVSDPFQLANILGCSVWYAGVLALRSHGVRPEEYGNLGAAIEASLIGIDTAVAVQIAKQMIYHRVADASRLDMSTGNLLYLSKKHGAEEMLNSLSADKMPHRLLVYHGGKFVIGSGFAMSSITNKTAEAARAVYNFLIKMPYV